MAGFIIVQKVATRTSADIRIIDGKAYPTRLAAFAAAEKMAANRSGDVFVASVGKLQFAARKVPGVDNAGSSD